MNHLRSDWWKPSPFLHKLTVSDAKEEKASIAQKLNGSVLTDTISLLV